MTRKESKKRSVTIVVLLLIFVLVGLFFLMNGKQSETETNVKIKELSGKRFEGFDDFYQANKGVWKLETITYLLKEQKFVSSKNELQQYLIYEANPGEIVKMTKSEGRWKFLEVVKNDSVIAKGWADVDKCSAEKLK